MMKKARIVMQKQLVNQVYPPFIMDEINQLVDIVGEPVSGEEVAADPSLLEDVEIILSSWGGPQLTQAVLDQASNLEVLLYAAGTVKDIVTPASWERGIQISTANVANAVPVAEYATSVILFSLKSGWEMIRQTRQTRTYPEWPYPTIRGAYKSRVGLISLSSVGRKTNEFLQNFDLEVVAYDPFVSPEEAEKLNVRMVSLEELFKESDVVSLHSPLLEETTGMITGELIDSMKERATFINTARGAIVKEEMIDVLKKRTDLIAVLDVTNPEPPAKDSQLYELDNVFLTPHIAGSLGNETGRLGEYMLGELRRYLNEEDLQFEVTEEKFKRMA